MELKDFFPMWDKLEAAQRRTLENAAGQRSVRKGEIIHSGDMECTGLYLVVSGQLRAYILSEEGREISIYRLFPRDICLFSASCIMRSIQFQVISISTHSFSTRLKISKNCPKLLFAAR
mgnify:CR=1 FL=1